MDIDFENYDWKNLRGEHLIPPVGAWFHASQAFRIEPSFFIIGVQKGGTTSLAQYLSEHPQIIQPQRKDIYYFNNITNYAKGQRWYRAHFASRAYQWWYEKRNSVSNTITFDSTPNYFSAPGAAERLHRHYPKAKLILVLRNPIERAWSNYRMSLWHKFEYLSFEDALRVEDLRVAAEWKRMEDPSYHSFVLQRLAYRTHGLYARYLRDWLKFFPREQIHIVKSEDLFDQPEQTYPQLLQFIGVDNDKRTDFEIFNKGKIEKPLAPEIEKQLTDFYRPHLEELYSLIGRDMNWLAT